MKRVSRTAYKVGSIREFADWSSRVIRDSNAARDVPKTWFDSEETAQRADMAQISPEAMVKLLSPGNLAVLAAIREHKPASVRELAALTGRKEASLSRTLRRFVQAGIVGFRDGPHRTRAPALIARQVHFDVDLTGARSMVTVDASR